MNKFRSLARSTILNLGAALGLVCLLWTLGTAVTGTLPVVFLSGSMSPAIDAGDLGFAREVAASEVAVGDIVSVTNADGNRVTHRVVEATPFDAESVALTLRGDANGSPDPDPYVVSTVDRIDAHVPNLGYVVAAVSSPWGLTAGLLLIVACLLLVVFGPRRPEDASRAHDSAPTTDGARRLKRRRRWLAPAVGIAATILLAGLVVPLKGTWAWYTDSPNLKSNDAGIGAAYVNCDRAMSQTATALRPWAYYKADDAGVLNLTKTLVDSSGGGRTMTVPGLLNSVSTNQARACSSRDVGSAVYFDGSTYAVTSDVSSVGNWNNFTVSMWFKAPAGTDGTLIGMGNSNTMDSFSKDRQLWMTPDGKLYFSLYPGSAVTTQIPGVFNTNQWFHVAVTLSPSGLVGYVNGTAVMTRAVTSGEGYTPKYWRLGGTSLSYWLNEVNPRPNAEGTIAATMDEIGIWTRALTAVEVRDLYRSSLP